jgi:hypothetical protein
MIPPLWRYHRRRDWFARSDHASNREHQQALYAFGGGGSGAAMRLSGCVARKEGDAAAAIGKSAAEALSLRAIVVPHEFMATQQGIAADLQGFGCSLCCAGFS